MTFQLAPPFIEILLDIRHYACLQRYNDQIMFFGFKVAQSLIGEIKLKERVMVQYEVCCDVTGYWSKEDIRERGSQ